MRRALVLGDETAHHPFRQVLPPHVRDGIARHPLRAQPRVSATARAGTAALALLRDMPRRLRALASPRRQRIRVTAQDVREFLLAYCACFLAVSAFIW